MTIENKAFAAWNQYEREQAAAEYGPEPDLPDDPPPEDRPRAPVKHRGQLRMAERFARDHALDLRHVHGIGWHQWDGSRWLLDEQRADLCARVHGQERPGRTAN